MTENLDGRILGVAIEHLRSKGYARLSMEGVAAGAGVAKTTVYRRYRNRADLATAALARDVAAMPDPAEATDIRAAFVEFLLTFGHRWSEFGLDVLGAMLVERDDRELLELHRERIIRPRQEYALALMARARDEGLIRPELDTQLAVEAMIGSFMASHVAGITRDPEVWAREVVDLVWDGLAA